METQNHNQKNFDEIVFENRNKNYGAYTLRKEYDKNVISSMIIAMGSFVLLVFIPLFIQYLLTKNNVQITDILKPEDRTIYEYKEIELPKNKVDIEEVKTPEPNRNTKADASSSFKVVNDTSSLDTKKFDSTGPVNNNNNSNPTNNGGGQQGNGGGEKKDTIAENTDKGVFENSEIMPEFKGGEAEFFRFLSKNIQYPEKVKMMGREGTVYISFVVDRLGKVKDVEVLKGMKNECDAEAIRVISLLPDWKPGTNNGKAVNVRFRIPIKFALRG